MNKTSWLKETSFRWFMEPQSEFWKKGPVNAYDWMENYKQKIRSENSNLVNWINETLEFNFKSFINPINISIN
jgi:hypothetical protein